MVLRRLAEAIREQNWFTVTLEIVIVVVGIFIGLKVEDWNQRLLERESDQRALALMVEELDLMLEEATTDEQMVTETLRALSSGMAIALNCDAGDDDRVQLTTAIVDTLKWRIPNIRPSGITELGNSARLARLGNPELTRAVGALHQIIQFISDSKDLAATLYDRAWQMLLPHLVLTAPIRFEKTAGAVGMSSAPPEDYLTLAPQGTLCTSQEFLLGLLLMASFYEASAFNFEAWYLSLDKAQQLARQALR